MKTTLRALSLLAACLLPRVSAATLLGSWSEVLGITEEPSTLMMAGVDICFGPDSGFDPCNPSGPGVALFESLLFSTADAGSILVATADTEPDFAAAARLLTNGVPDLVKMGLRLEDGAGSSTTVPEARLSGIQGEDFDGYSIESIQLRLHDNFRVILEPGAIPGQDRLVASGRMTLAIFGSPVPEPSAAVSIGIGLGLLSRRRLRGSVGGGGQTRTADTRLMKPLL